MGIASGATVEVFTGSKDTNFLIGIGNTRLGLEYKLANAITVQKL
jgi:Fe2+ transport system protein FeoA